MSSVESQVKAIVAEQAIAKFVQRRRGAVVEARQELLLCFARSVDQQPLHFRDPGTRRRMSRQFAGGDSLCIEASAGHASRVEQGCCVCSRGAE